MKVFRIEREKYLDQTLRGTGAALTDGFRWNSLNTYLVYTADSLALAILEVTVHLNLHSELPTDRHYVEIDIPASVEILELKFIDLPESWNAKPPASESQQMGDDFIIQNKAAVLKVPSSIVPLEFNYLINPNHPQAKKITVVSHAPMSLDARLTRQ